MEVDCEGCAGCCLDWRDASLDVVAPERTGTRQPIDDAHNFAALEREEVRRFLEDGLGDVLTPRLWTLPTDTEDGSRSEGENRDDDDDTATDGGAAASQVPDTVAIDGYDLAAVRGRPVFYVGLRKPPKPVAPFDTEPAWRPTCAFLDPETLQCRIHGEASYPDACAAYPAHNLLLEQETECERAEAAYGGQRLLDDEPPVDPPGVGVGPHALGSKLFAHPDPDDLAGRIERIADGITTDEDRATFAAVAAASSPGTLAVAEERREVAFEQALAAESWVGRAIDEWETMADDAPAGSAADVDPSVGERVEIERGAPETPGWE